MHLYLARRAYSASGGAEKYLLRLAQALLDKNHQVTLLSDRNWPKEALPQGLNTLVFPAKTPQQFALALKTWQQEQKTSGKLLSLERLYQADVYRSGDGVHAAWLERRRAFEPAWKHYTRKLNAKHAQILKLESCLAANPQTQLICNSQLVARQWQQYYGVPSQRLHHIPNGFDSKPLLSKPERQTLRQEIAQELSISPEDSWGLFVGSGFERKGLPLLLEALRKQECSKQLPRLPQLLIAGKGKLSSSQQSNLPANAHLLGARPDIPRLLQACDWFCLPTWYDPFSNATLEAAAYALPVITTSANGFSEQMHDQIHGSILTENTKEAKIIALSKAIGYWSNLEVSNAARAACHENAARLSMEANVNATLACLRLEE